jgi:hypothetical protein
MNANLTLSLLFTFSPTNTVTATDEAVRLFYEVIYNITQVLFGVSVLAAIFTIVTFTIFSRIRTYPIKLIMYLCITIVFGHTAFAVSQYFIPWPGVCAAVGAFVHYFLLSNFFWCFCIAFNFYQMIVKRNSGTRQLEKYYHLIGWGTPCVAVIIVSGVGEYGQNTLVNGTCYIQNNPLIFATFFLPGLILISANAVLFFFVASEIHGTLAKAPDSEQRERTKEFRVLMSIFVTVGLSWIFAFLNSILMTVPILNYIVLVLMTMFTPLQGFFIFVAYCLNKKVQLKWMGIFAKCFPCCAVDGTVTQTTGTKNTAGRSGYSSSTHASVNSSSRSGYSSRT